MKKPIHYKAKWIKKPLLIMKLIIILSFCTVIQLMASGSYAQETKLTLKHQLASVDQVLQDIEDKSDFFFLYNHKLVDVSKQVSVDYKDMKINKILDNLFNGENVKYYVMDKQIILSPADMAPLLNSAAEQPPTVTGTVTDASNGNPLIGATVQIKGTTSGTVTGLDGNYRITVPEDATLVFSYVGYSDQEIPVAGQTTINIQLEEEVRELEEIVVIGYGTRERKDVTTSISTVDSKQINESIGASPELAMQGRMTGVHVTSPGGDPTHRPEIQIRGMNTWGVSSPLYVIDGIPMTEFGSGYEGMESANRSRRSDINVMTLINPNDIESISVLKDASAAAIYGVRAANGVILITTKRGKAGRPRINFDARYGVSNMTRTYDVLNVDQYVDLYQEAFANNPAETANMPPEFDPASAEYLGDLPTVDWQDPLLNRNAPYQDYSLQVSGGNEAVTYFLSAGYSYKEGSTIHNWLERYSLSSNVDATISERIHAGFNYKFAYSELKESGKHPITDVAFNPPWQPIYDPDAPEEHMGYQTAIGDTSYDATGTWSYDMLWGVSTGGNPYAIKDLTLDERTLMRHTGNGYVEAEIVKGLKVKGSVMIDLYENTREEFDNADFVMFRSNPKYDPLSLCEDLVDDTYGEYKLNEHTNYNLVKEFTINYNRSFGEHNVDLVLNAMDQQYGYHVLGAGTEYTTSEDPLYWSVGAPAVDWVDGSTFERRWALQGYMGRLSYNYANRYYLDATLRRDGTSRFAPENRWGWFPSFSAAWRVSAEPFMQGLTWMNDLKLRAGWGQLGNQETMAFSHLSNTVSTGAASFGYDPDAKLVPGMGYFYSTSVIENFPNADLQWETTTTLNIGFDAFILNGLEWSFEYYNKLTDGILQQSKIPASMGYDWVGHRPAETKDPPANIGQVVNSGIETMLGYRGSVGDFRYYVSGNLTTVHNEVKKLFRGTPTVGLAKVDQYWTLDPSRVSSNLQCTKIGK